MVYLVAQKEHRMNSDSQETKRSKTTPQTSSSSSDPTSKVDEKLSDLLDIGSIDREIIEQEESNNELAEKPAEKEPTKDERDAEKDFEFIRGNMRRLIQTGEASLQDLGRLAEELENPRAYEVLGKFYEQMISANERLASLHEKKQKMKLDKEKQSSQSSVSEQSGPTNSGMVVNSDNVVFVGTPDQLGEHLKNSQKSKKVSDDDES